MAADDRPTLRRPATGEGDDGEGEGDHGEPGTERHADLLAPREGVGGERADAARNRQRVLDAAERLFASRDPASVTMGDIARLAGVGRATLYRRYPDTSSIALALLDEHERRIQQQLMSGPPPLGPGAEPADRLAAFYAAMVELLEAHLPLALGAETGLRRFSAGAYGFWRAHVLALLDEVQAPDAEVLVDLLLAPLAPEVFHHQRRRRGLRPEQITDALAWQARRLLDPFPRAEG